MEIDVASTPGPVITPGSVTGGSDGTVVGAAEEDVPVVGEIGVVVGGSGGETEVHPATRATTKPQPARARHRRRSFRTPAE